MKRNWGKIRRFIPMYLMLLPGLVYLFINNYMPMAGIIIAFKKYNYSLGIFKSPFTGLKNFEFLFKTKDAWTIVSAKYCYITHELRLHQNDRCKRFTPV